MPRAPGDKKTSSHIVHMWFTELKPVKHNLLLMFTPVCAGGKPRLHLNQLCQTVQPQQVSVCLHSCIQHMRWQGCVKSLPCGQQREAVTTAVGEEPFRSFSQVKVVKPHCKKYSTTGKSSHCAVKCFYYNIRCFWILLL